MLYASYEKKENGKYVETWRTENREGIYERLAQALISKKLHHCTYYKRITDSNNYDGTRTIVMYDDIGGRNIFRIESKQKSLRRLKTAFRPQASAGHAGGVGTKGKHTYGGKDHA